MALPAKTRLGPYEILEPLGAGGMGEVYKARDTRLGRDVALKVLPAEFATNPQRRERFEHEARTVAALNHPNIVAVYDIGEQDGVVFMVSELVDGETLRQASLPVRKALDIAAQVADGLAAAHTAAVTHRDLKPENVMVTRDGRAKILDFGLAKVHRKAAPGESTETLTEAGTVMGTVGYMSPEQVRGAEVDHRSDIFSFGAVLHEMLSGARAFKGATPVETMNAILSADAPPLADTVPSSVRDLVDHCLEKKPEQRFQSAKDLAFALRAMSGRTSATSEALPVLPSKPRRRAPLWAAAAMLVAGVLIGGVAALRWASTLDTGQDPVRLSRFASELALEVNPAFSPDGRSVAYLRTTGSTSEILVQGLDALTPVVLASQTGLNAGVRPMWTADGTRVCYVAMRDLWCVGAAGGTPQRLLSDVISAVFPRDGRSVWVTRSDASKVRLFASSPPGAPAQPVEGFTLPEGAAGIVGVSPDGTKLLVGGGGTGAELWIAPFPNGPPRKLPLEANTGVLAAGWLPDNRHVVVVKLSLVGLGFRLLIADTESSAERLLLPDTGAIISAAVSPDGRRIMYSTGQPEWDIVEYSMDGKRVRPMVASSVMDVGPMWHPSGDRFVYGVIGTGQARSTWTRAADGSNAVLVPGPSDAGGAPIYSPDGRRFAYTAGGSGAIETLPAAGGQPVRIYSRAGAFSLGPTPCWSPDGEWLWFQEGPVLRKVPSQGGGQAITVKEGMGGWALIDCSPDGSLAYSNREGVHLLSPDGKQDRMLIADPSLQGGQFGEGGKALYLRRADGRSLAVVDVATGTVRRTVEFELAPADVMNAFSIHPDGKSILMMTGGLRYDLWMAEGFAQPAKGWKSWFRHWEITPATAVAGRQEGPQ